MATRPVHLAHHRTREPSKRHCIWGSMGTQGQSLVAQRWLDGIESAIRFLRQIPFHGHRIIYAVRRSTVEVLHIRRGARCEIGPGEIDD